MYLRHSTITKNGKTHTYWRLVRSVRVGTKVRQETVAQLGELDAKGRSRRTIWPTRSSVWSVNPGSSTRNSPLSPSPLCQVVCGWDAVGGSATSGSPGNSGRRSDSIRGWRNVCPEAAKMCRGA